ncbi:MAG TPA: hypothetical protein PLU72_03305 [Candidatus Ozemobacteraceae bacterium]|nr:hypothetical protein [Candidatus Ozemobacteraceae bacterium]
MIIRPYASICIAFVISLFLSIGLIEWAQKRDGQVAVVSYRTVMQACLSFIDTIADRVSDKVADKIANKIADRVAAKLARDEEFRKRPEQPREKAAARRKPRGAHTGRR